MKLEIERVVLAALRSNRSEPYELTKTNQQALRRTVARVVQQDNAVEEISGALSLAIGLRDLGAIAAADHIEELLRDEPAALAILAEDVAPPPSIDQERAFRMTQGQAAQRAPMYDSPRPPGHRLADFLDPASTGAIRHPFRRLPFEPQTFDPTR